MFVMSEKENLVSAQVLVLKKALEVEKEKVLLLKQELVRANNSIQESIIKNKKDLFLLQAMQKILIPDEWDYLSGFKISAKYNSGELGGDYYDIFGSKSSKTFNIWMSHSSSIALSALLTSVVLNLGAESSSGIKVFLSQLYKELSQVLEEQHFFDFFYASLDRARLELSFVTQGSMLCFHYRGEDLISLVKCGDPVSLFTPVDKIQTIKLLPQDRLVICTGGMSLEKNQKNEFFGMQRVIDIINLNLDTHALRNELFLAVKNFTGTELFRNDHSVIVLDVKSQALRLV